MNYTVGVILWLAIGWVSAHIVVATECTRLGGFYVGKTVYTCKVKE